MGNITLYNRGRQSFQTKSGVIEPGKSLTVNEEEAKNLAGYADLVDASKMVGGATAVAEINELKSSNTKLKAENGELKSEVEKLTKEIEKLKEAAKDAKPETDKVTEPSKPEPKKEREAKTKRKK